MRTDNMQIEVRPAGHFIQTTLKGVVDTEAVVKRLAETYAGLVEPWLFDQLLDVRGLINVFTHKDFLAISQMWNGIAANYRPLHFAVVTTDPFRLERTQAFAPRYENVVAQTFPTVEQAAAWLTGGFNPMFVQASAGR